MGRIMAYVPHTLEYLCDLKDEHPELFRNLEQETILIRTWLQTTAGKT